MSERGRGGCGARKQHVKKRAEEGRERGGKKNGHGGNPRAEQQAASPSKRPTPMAIVQTKDFGGSSRDDGSVPSMSNGFSKPRRAMALAGMGSN